MHRRNAGKRWLTLYRGQNDIEHEIVETLPNSEAIVNFNNLCSFTVPFWDGQN
ncbi:MAG: hypothetical protein JW841_02545 [Deltaproteobacteria bacterium]|nr:hypothetical protein [Deltaproteobacteria bacterium]